MASPGRKKLHEQAKHWMRQAEADIALAEEMQSSRFAVACYFAQQAAEKAIKATHIHHGNERVTLIHDLVALMKGGPASTKKVWADQKPIVELAITLTRFEATARYPGLLGKVYGAPVDMLKKADATHAVTAGKRIFGICKNMIGRS